jgi:ABC-type dipeptide/oligopeptide/nickel transport system permease component
MNLGYIIRRTIQSLLLLLGVTLIVFLLLRITPSDPAAIMLGENASPEALAALRESLGLNKPLHEQYLSYLGSLLMGDWGVSIRSQRPALAIVAERLPATAELAAVSMFLALVVSIPIGILAAIKRNSAIDGLSMLGALITQSVPGYWLGLMLIILFAVVFNLLPSSGRGSWYHLILPGITLASFLIGLITRLTRSCMLEVLQQDYLRTARSKGLSERVVMLRHALKNAMIPVITVVGLQIGNLLGGAVVTETVFAWPGIGSLAVVSIYQRDYPVVQAVVLLSAAVFVIINFLLDVIYQWLDPRISYAGHVH